MSADPSPELLAGVVTRTLEEAAFVFAERADAAAPFGGDVIEARLSYAGPRAGEIRIAATPAFASMLAANLLGTEPDDPGAAARGMDAVGELLNMVCGVLVSELFGPEATCRLGVPAVGRLVPESYEAGIAASPCRVTLVEEGGQRIDASAIYGREDGEGR